jgi:copper(I)-binding protein
MMRRAALVITLLVGACRAQPGVGGTAEQAGVTVRRAVAWGTPGVAGASAGLELTLAAADTLVALRTPQGTAAVHASKHEGQHGMFPTGPLPLPAGRTLIDGAEHHVMIEDLPAPLRPGDSLALELRFVRAGAVTVVVPVLRYSDALAALGR